MKNSRFTLVFITLCFWGFSCNSDTCSEDSYTANAKLFSSRYSNDSLRYLYEIKDCYPTGVHLSFYKNGKIKEYGYSESGKMIGEWLYYKNDGNLLSRMYYNGNGKLDHVTDAKGIIVFDYKTLQLRTSTGESVNFKGNNIISNSHPTDIKLYNWGNDTLILETSSFGIFLNGNLKEIGRINMNREE